MKCLRRLEDTDFPCDKISNPDKEERISMEDLSNTRRFLKGFKSDESETMTTGKKDKRAQRTKLQKLQRACRSDAEGSRRTSRQVAEDFAGSQGKATAGEAHQKWLEEEPQVSVRVLLSRVP